MGRPPLLTRLFLLCFAANLAQGLSFNLFLHLPGLLKELGAGEVEIGFLFGLTAASAIAARPGIGRHMDVRGRRTVILTGAVLNILVCSLYLGVRDIGAWLVIARVAHGLSESMLFAALFTYAADIVPPERRTEGLALFGVSGILPISLAGLLGDAVLAVAGYYELFVVAIGFGVVTLAAVLPLPERRPDGEGEGSRGFLQSVRQRDLVPIWFIGTVFATALASIFTFIKTYVMETGAGSVGAFFTAYSGAAVALRIFLAWLPDRVGPKRVLFPAMGVLAAGFLLLARAEGAGPVIVAGICCGLGHGFTFPILSGLVVTRARAAERGAAMALFTAIFDAGLLIGGPTLGAIIRVGGYPAMYRVAAGLVVAGIVVFAMWDRGRR